jgi:leucyl aminopeptidase (aminopeptidase T)
MMEARREEMLAQCKERHELSMERIREIAQQAQVGERFQAYMTGVAKFLVQLEDVRGQIETRAWDALSLEEMAAQNQALYADILGNAYETSYANPTYAVEKLGADYGQLLSLLYVELRGGIPSVFENRLDYLTIYNELFLEIYHHFEEEEEPNPKSIKDTLYWYASDYCDVFLADRVEEQILPEATQFATDLILQADLDDDRYLYRFGEYISENELGTARHLRHLPESVLRRMADVYTEGYRVGFINTGKDLSKKKVVCIRYCLGFEKMVRIAIENFEKMGLRPVIFRAATSVITKKEHSKVGYYGAIANKQYEYDHRLDQALFMDKGYIERKLDVMKTVYEKYKEEAAYFGGPAVLEIFGEEPFAPQSKAEAVTYDDAQRNLALLYDRKSSQMTNQYIKGEERSFTIVAYPIPEIGPEYAKIFDETIRINTLDASLYERIQQTLIDALDQGEYVYIRGKGKNRTDLMVHLCDLKDPSRETKFENCVADVNIPVGEVFTTPVLEGTNGTLHVTKVYLNELQYENLEMKFVDGKIASYTCSNFEDEESCKAYVKENILHNHETLPLGEFAIGTNTTAFVVAKKYQIEEKMPILIAEKMGPHFAVGDTCYSWSEEIKIYNPNGKEIIAKDNSVSIQRKESLEKAYLQCHTDITIPYDELGEIRVKTKDGRWIDLIQDGRFVLEGTQELNLPFDEKA